MLSLIDEKAGQYHYAAHINYIFLFKIGPIIYHNMEQPSRDVAAISREFNALIRDLIAVIERKSRSDMEIVNLDRLKKRISILKSTLGDTILIQLAAPFFLNFSEVILNPDARARDEFFMNMDVRAEYLKYRSTVAKQDEFVFELSDSVRSHYRNINQAERDGIYNKVTSMLRCAIEYKMIVPNDNRATG